MARCIYNAVGQMAASQNPLSYRTSQVYDTAGRQVATLQPLGQRSTRVYNQADQLIATINANDRRTTLIYDPLGASRHKSIHWDSELPACLTRPDSKRP